jgi:cytochrome c-type biogenesis protein CcmH/NrfF
MERHRFDALSLVFGLLFVAAGLLLLSGGPALSQSLPMEWVGPLVAIGLGAVLLLAARPEREKADDEGVDADLEPAEPV